MASRLLVDGWWRLIHGDQASWLIELAKRAPLPEGFESESIDFIHANHYFTLPFAERLMRGRKVPVVLETQDIQARQYVLRNKGGFFIPPYATYDGMLEVELAWMRRADLCAHLNEEEHRDFQKLLPELRHALIYPAVASAPLARGRDIIIVASDNYANYMSLRWFLQEVMPFAGDARVAIYGNIDGGVKRRDAALYESHRALFKGRVDDIGAVYANAGCVLLPTVEGHGLSIKAVEALSCGAPLVATPLAFRGMQVDPAKLRKCRSRRKRQAICGLMARSPGARRERRSSQSRSEATRAACTKTRSAQRLMRALWRWPPQRSKSGPNKLTDGRATKRQIRRLRDREHRPYFFGRRPARKRVMLQQLRAKAIVGAVELCLGCGSRQLEERVERCIE